MTVIRLVFAGSVKSMPWPDARIRRTVGRTEPAVITYGTASFSQTTLPVSCRSKTISWLAVTTATTEPRGVVGFEVILGAYASLLSMAAS